MPRGRRLSALSSGGGHLTATTGVRHSCPALQPVRTGEPVIVRLDHERLLRRGSGRRWPPTSAPCRSRAIRTSSSEPLPFDSRATASADRFAIDPPETNRPNLHLPASRPDRRSSAAPGSATIVPGGLQPGTALQEATPTQQCVGNSSAASGGRSRPEPRPSVESTLEDGRRYPEPPGSRRQSGNDVQRRHDHPARRSSGVSTNVSRVRTYSNTSPARCDRAGIPVRRPGPRARRGESGTGRRRPSVSPWNGEMSPQRVLRRFRRRSGDGGDVGDGGSRGCAWIGRRIAWLIPLLLAVSDRCGRWCRPVARNQ